MLAFLCFWFQRPPFFNLPRRNSQPVINARQSLQPAKFRTIHFSYTVSAYRRQYK